MYNSARGLKASGLQTVITDIQDAWESVKLHLIQHQNLLNYILEQCQYVTASSSTGSSANLANTSCQIKMLQCNDHWEILGF